MASAATPASNGDAVNGALHELLAHVFEAQEHLPEHLYLKINDAAMNVRREHLARTESSAASGMAGIMERVRLQVFGHLHDLRDERDGLTQQLQSATVVIDRLRDKCTYHTKCVSALRSVCVAHEIPDSRLLEAYAAVGVKKRVLEERKRKRDTPVVVVSGDED
jgi:hypothetical protein